MNTPPEWENVWAGTLSDGEPVLVTENPDGTRTITKLNVRPKGEA